MDGSAPLSPTIKATYCIGFQNMLACKILGYPYAGGNFDAAHIIARFVSKHFLDKDYEKDLMYELLNINKAVSENTPRRLKPFPVPSQNMPVAQTSRKEFFCEFLIITHVSNVLITYHTTKDS